MNTEKKWISAHELCKKELSGEVVLPTTLLFWAEHYAAKMAAPIKTIPGLIEVMKGALERVYCPGQYGVLEAEVEKAVAMLEEQLEEQPKDPGAKPCPCCVGNSA